MSDDDMTAVDWRAELSERLLDIASSPKFDGATHPMVRRLSEDYAEVDRRALRAFLEVAFEEIAEKLADNHEAYSSDGPSYGGADVTDYEAVAGALIQENVTDIDVRQNDWHAPTVRVWLKDCPVWANWAGNETFRFSVHREHYNGDKTMATLDVRPY